MKSPTLGTFSYFGKVASLITAFLATACILVYVDPKPFSFLVTQTNFYVALCLNAPIAYLIIRASIWGTRLLDNRHPWQRSYRKRWPRQLLFAISIPLLVCMLGVSIYFLLYGKNILETNFFTKYLFLDTVGILLLNAVLFFMYQQQLNRRHRPDRKVDVVQELNFPLPISEIAYLYAENKYCYAVGFNGAREPLETSLTKALSALPREQFCLARRSHIVNRKAVKRLIKRNGTIKVQLLPKLALSIMVSRQEMHPFNNWWEEPQEQPKL